MADKSGCACDEDLHGCVRVPFYGVGVAHFKRLFYDGSRWKLSGRGLGLLLAESSHVFSDGCFALRVSDSMKELECVLKAEPGHFGFAQVVPGHAHLVESFSLGGAIVEDFEFGDCLLENVDRLHWVIDHEDVGRAEIRESQRLASAVLKFAEDGEGLIQALDALFLLLREK